MFLMTINHTPQMGKFKTAGEAAYHLQVEMGRLFGKDYPRNEHYLMSPLEIAQIDLAKNKFVKFHGQTFSVIEI